MAANLYERIMQIGDYENDGGFIDCQDFQSSLALYEAGLTTASAIKTRYSCTTAQGGDIDTLVGTMPTTLLTFLNAVNRARWVDRTFHVLKRAQQLDPDYDTVAKVKGALGT